MSVRLHSLPNGMRVVSEHMPGLKSAAIGIWVAAGARHERADQNGIAHFLEHMAFKGTKRRSALDIAEEIEDVGGHINAWTSREMTAYYARVLQEDVPLALDVIADIVLNSTFDPREIETERGVILQEIGQVQDTPDDVIFDWLQEASYSGQPLGRSILGPAERVAAFGRDDLLGFVSDHYSPGRMILAAAGAVDHDQLVADAERLFGALPARPAGAPESGRFTGGEARRLHDLEQAHLALAFEAPGQRDEAIYASQIFSMVLGGGMSSRLFQEAREKRGLCYSIFASAGAFEDTGMMTLYAGTSGEDVEALAMLCIDEIRRAGEDISETEVARARAQLRAGMLMGLESPSARCERLARLLSVWGRVPTPEEILARIDAVDADAVRARAGALMEAGQGAMALYGPVAGAPELEALLERLAA